MFIVIIFVKIKGTNAPLYQLFYKKLPLCSESFVLSNQDSNLDRQYQKL